MNDAKIQRGTRQNQRPTPQLSCVANFYPTCVGDSGGVAWDELDRFAVGDEVIVDDLNFTETRHRRTIERVEIIEGEVFYALDALVQYSPRCYWGEVSWHPELIDPKSGPHISLLPHSQVVLA